VSASGPHEKSYREALAARRDAEKPKGAELEQSQVVIIVAPGRVADARRLFPGALVVGHGDRPSLVGRRFALVMRTMAVVPKDEWEQLVAMRLVPHARTIVGDVGSLVAIYGAIAELAPWIIAGRPARPPG
jgi:hypothetical protein